jgi:hypothetical protein
VMMAMRAEAAAAGRPEGTPAAMQAAVRGPSSRPEVHVSVSARIFADGRGGNIVLPTVSILPVGLALSNDAPAVATVSCDAAAMSYGDRPSTVVASATIEDACYSGGPISSPALASSSTRAGGDNPLSSGQKPEDVMVRAAEPLSTEPQLMKQQATEPLDDAVKGVTPTAAQPVNAPISQGSTASSSATADALARRLEATVRAAEDGLRIASQQEDEAVRSLKSAEMELQEAKSAEAERVKRAAARAPPPKKGGILRNMLKKKKPAADWPAADEVPVSLSPFEAKVEKLRGLVAAMEDAKMAADQSVQRAKRDMATALEKATVSSVQPEAKVSAEPVVMQRSDATTEATEALRQDEPHSQPAVAVPESRLEVQSSASSPGGNASLVDDRLTEGGGEDYEHEMEEGEEESDEDVDSDFDLGDTKEPVQLAAMMHGQLLLAKLYGLDGAVTSPPDEIEWDLKTVTLYADGTIWHVGDGMLGRLDLNDVHAASYTKGRTNEICLSQHDKCHLLRILDGSTAQITAWLEAIHPMIQS